MAMLLAVLLLGTLGSKIPTDAEIAARIEDEIRASCHPASVRVVVKRHSALSTTLERVDITIVGFTADNLPMATAAAPSVRRASTAPTRTPTAPTAPTTPAARTNDRQIHVVEAHLCCEEFIVKSLPVQRMVWDGRNVYLSWNSIKAGVFRISAAESMVGSLVLQQQGLTDFIRTCPVPLDVPEVVIRPNECLVNGTTRTFVGMPVQLSGRLVARDGAVLYLDNPRLKVSVLPIPAAVSSRLLKDINPLVNLNTAFQLPAPLAITGTTLGDGILRFEGRLMFPQPESR